MALLGHLRVLQEHWLGFSIFAIVLYLLRNKYYHGLQAYPGPWLAAYTNWWRFFDTLSGSAERTHIRLHQQNGDIVRLGPNMLSFSDPRAIKDIYGLNRGVSNFYPVQQALSKGQRLQSLFSTVDEVYHSKYRRCINNAFTMSSLVSYEGLIDSTTSFFIEQTQKLFVDTRRSCDFNQWLQFYAFDVIGELTWSQRIGFLERNYDIDGIVRFIGEFLEYASLNISTQKLSAANRISAPEDTKGGKRQNVDLMTKFLQAKEKHPDFMTDSQVLASAVSMINAGSDTTSISLSAAFYLLLKNPRCYSRLMEELDEAYNSGRIGGRNSGLVSWAESQTLPYLDSVIQETFRLHPAVGLLLERVVPEGGLIICGRHIPAGTIVGCNAWVLHRRADIFGEDTNAFRPERWIEASTQELSNMKAAMCHFGSGARSCIGKSIAMLEIYKLLPAFLLHFEIELDGQDNNWTTRNFWFVKQSDFNTRFAVRDRQGKGANSNSNVSYRPDP
ncbi:hypothetical protein FQN53_007968 [Emmonsiellopsis sp. PD_33]|nr:hypothetical protein FQN53_007968 [Emmonsiellopsis sp. PD_33]